jgi:hypothetical protein
MPKPPEWMHYTSLPRHTREFPKKMKQSSSRGGTAAGGGRGLRKGGDDYELVSYDDAEIGSGEITAWELKSRCEKFIENPPLMDFFSEDLKFNYTRNQDLTETELDEICDGYKIPRTKRRKEKEYSLSVIYQKGTVQKCVLLFYRQTESETYNILLSEAERFCQLDRSKVAAAGCTAIGASLFMFSYSNPIVASMTLAASSLAVAGKLISDSKYHAFEDLVLGYMIRELERMGVIVFRDAQCFLHEGGQLIAITSTDLSL